MEFMCCLFSRDICDSRLPCIDDLLYGTCGGSNFPDSFAFQLSEHDLMKLGDETGKLVLSGFTWGDGYTQCIVQNVILSLASKEPFSKLVCYDLLYAKNKPVSDEVNAVIAELYDESLNRGLDPVNNFDEISLIPNSQKRDEIVRVHKYFDKNEKLHKRYWDPFKDGIFPYGYYPQDDPFAMSPKYFNSPQDPVAEWENTRIPLEDLQLVRKYLESTRKPTSHRSKLSELLDSGSLNFQRVLNNNGQTSSYVRPNNEFRDFDIQPNNLLNGDGQQIGFSQPEEVIDSGDLGSPSDDLEELGNPGNQAGILEDMSLPPKYANILDKLIRGETSPHDLSEKELEFLTPYVTEMLYRLNAADDSEQDLGHPEALGDHLRPFGIEQEDMMSGPGVKTDPEQSVVKSDDHDLDTKVNTLSELELESQLFQKKSAKGGESSAVQNEDIVDTNFAFIEMDKELDVQTAEKLIEALGKIVAANPGTLNNNIVEGRKLKIKVDPVLAGVNASFVAQQASDHEKDLEDATGLKFVKSGIGSLTEVAYKAHDDRYFILTFVLCGCIAGILLAVFVVYLIRRNSRSKDKLQQITAGPEGNAEAASKDYQDLCRQRMQSKSSEKPEPLHAATSRMGSVSEAQVRSPSSRSSTSSWSEEPVNSNMDISTGHIVLTYMEDHLKNKDRLDREWEAMCAYEADPCSSNVATEMANARKNRYSDVLPYDHSRVVLTTNTNVSGSDYINASTITDHDPRNPAYVATQGPLPHTVADFWQMVWEQGSVVIVMLTKLTETGEAKCHRYWPEEGSDLYHIYEVHLVSEHIWCEDYLVRSFYLKNLQTGETRTVTQFNFLTWPDLGIPTSIKALLDFRRKVNKSYRGRSCPILVHCSDGCGRTGTYCLIDMVLNRMAKGAKEIDIAATLEHIRDQRVSMVKTKEQFQFALAAVAEEVHAILKALPQ
ncbi:receptor-type tyrosine-protein phosphatase N2-like isoform X2 [Dreissena polymorpha]|uniref:receptor-type tyrosine-protein phosphatase N2-like isoform X2 n=1 Tax=Dreissena polymorpha TaxID=45954 RepID=UPI0022656508|nr:receptor-type tyrosine-protein phosphatase N2-like isoform X2 [Dreissena polymorpha]